MKQTTILSIALLITISLFLTSFLAADDPQGGHQTMIITAFKAGKDITMAISEKGVAYREEVLKTDKSDGELGPLLSFIDQQYAKGWKLHSSNLDGGYYYFLLEK